MRPSDLTRPCRAAVHDLLTLRVNLVLIGLAALASALCAMVFVAFDPSAASSTEGANSRAAQLISALGLAAGLVSAAISSTTIAADAEHGVTRTRSIAAPRASRRFTATMLASALVAAGCTALCMLTAVVASWPVLAHLGNGWAPGLFLLQPIGVGLAIAVATGLIGASIGMVSESGQAATVAALSLLVAAPFVLLISSLPHLAALLPAGLAVSAISLAANDFALPGLLGWALGAMLAAAAAPALMRLVRTRPRATKRLTARSAKPGSRAPRLSPARIEIAAVLELVGSRAFMTSLVVAPFFMLGAAAAAASSSQPLDPEGGGFMRLDTYALAAGQPVAQLMIALTTCVVTAGAINGPVARSFAVAVPRRSDRALSLIVAPAIATGVVAILAMAIAAPAVSHILDYNGVLPEQRDGALLLTGARQAAAAALTTALAAVLTILFGSAAVAGALLIVFVVVAPMALGTLSFVLAPADQQRTLWLDALADLLPGQLSDWASQIPPTIELPQVGVATAWLAALAIAGLAAHTRRNLA